LQRKGGCGPTAHSPVWTLAPCRLREFLSGIALAAADALRPLCIVPAQTMGREEAHAEKGKNCRSRMPNRKVQLGVKMDGFTPENYG